MMNKKGSVTLYFSFMIVAIIVIVLAGILAPMGVKFNTEMYRAGEQLLIDANDSMQSINDIEVKDRVTSANDEALAGTENNIDVNQFIFQYGWVFVVLIAGVILFLRSRQIAEFGGMI